MSPLGPRPKQNGAPYLKKAAQGYKNKNYIKALAPQHALQNCVCGTKRTFNIQQYKHYQSVH